MTIPCNANVSADNANVFPCIKNATLLRLNRRLETGSTQGFTRFRGFHQTLNLPRSQSETGNAYFEAPPP
ncbi:MAG: hypothetical protein HWQ41_19455 [Nostoc sp. NOS(2021)]|uniref:hypothetical protein n=1 Tax=Nostoc sp. NOS(2021) TaxID=2815407 RepID=UPI0025D29634|nr:hypothetical protein [Nostoc sp. NOS(2021)]MBN3897373.1 hypothetical protein [Nostoc sp. NOS(2021)]